MTLLEMKLKQWAESLPHSSSEIDVDVTKIPGACIFDGTIKATYLYGHDYHFRNSGSPICKAYTNAGFSYVSYDEATQTLRLKNLDYVNRVPDIIGISPSIMHSFVSRLKEYNNALISFYIAETKSVLTTQQYDAIANAEVFIDETNELYYEIVGRYDLRDVIRGLSEILEVNAGALKEFRERLTTLRQILTEILELEAPLYKGEPFSIPNSTFQHITRVRDLDSELKSLIEEIRRMLNEGQWSNETRKLIEDILNRIWPRIVGRKRASTVLGKFTASQNRITLYQLAIEKWLPTTDYFKKLLDVYSHELFHAFHYVHMKEPKQWKYDDKSRMVTESLARYIEYRYNMLYICENAISADFIRTWNEYDMCDFPYAGAKYVDKFSGLCELMFKESAGMGTKKAFHLIDSASKL